MATNDHADEGEQTESKAFPAAAPQHDRPGPQVVVLPNLWAPMHHRSAVAALTGFVANTAPDAVVFLDVPPAEPGEMWEAFTDVVGGFRAVYGGPITVRASDDHERHAAGLAAWRVSVIAPLTPIAPGWLVAPDNPLQAKGGVIGCAQQAGASLVSGSTGRLRITGRAVPAEGGGSHVWLVFECGTLAEDRQAGTLGFGVLEGDGRDVSAYPVRIGADGSFTFHHRRHTAPAPPVTDTRVDAEVGDQASPRSGHVGVPSSGCPSAGQPPPERARTLRHPAPVSTAESAPRSFALSSGNHAKDNE